MLDVYATIVGTALTTPERRRLEKSNALVTSFRVTSNARRFDRETQQWVDAPNLRIRVTCWRRLADHVADSVRSGDAIVVYGRMSTREWKTPEGESRITFEMDADSVGHDLNRGRAQFTRARVEPHSVIEDAESENRINGEVAHLVHEPGAPVAASAQEEYDEFGYGVADLAKTDEAALALLREAGLAPSEPNDDDEDEDEEALVGATAGSGGSGGRGRRRGR